MPLTATAWENFKIRQGTREPGSYRIGSDGGGSVLTGILPSADLDTILREGIETATADNELGRIRRILPVAHPKWYWYFLKDVTNVQGVSFVEKVEADPEGTLESPPIPYFADYTKYEMQATFEPRPYALLADETITPTILNYYDTAGGAQTRTVFHEWWRYVEWVKAPAAEYLTADIGQYTFANPGGPAAPGDRTGPVDQSGAGRGQVRVLVPSSTWKVNWYKVPYQYVLSDNSFFEKYIGYVNQQTWGGFFPGEALLQAVNVLRIYPPPFPEFTSYAGYDVVSQDKLCDLEFVILAVNRKATVTTPYTPTNLSHVIDGHNTVIFSPNGQYYYVENFRAAGAAAGTGKPIYPSVPYEILFQNPDWSG